MKEGGEVQQSAKDMKAQDAMKNAGEMKAEGMKLKDVLAAPDEAPVMKTFTPRLAQVSSWAAPRGPWQPAR